MPEELTDRARELRRNPTEAERRLWLLLRRYRPAFTRQLAIGPYIVDLACRQAKLAIEFDGSQPLDQTAYDARRTEALHESGWAVIRFWNSEVAENPEGVAQAILLKAAECLGGTHPQPLPFREGRPRRQRQPIRRER